MGPANRIASRWAAARTLRTMIRSKRPGVNTAIDLERWPEMSMPASAIWLRQVFLLQTNSRRGRRRVMLEKGDE